MNATEAANTLKFVADDHPCCAVALASIIAWLESLCPNGNAERKSKTFVAKDGRTQLESASEDEVRDFAEVAKCNGVQMKLFCRELWVSEYELPENP